MLFIGNPTYEKIYEKIGVNLEENSTSVDPDGIFGVEFLGFREERPTIQSLNSTPYRFIKAQRLFEARKLKFRPGCVETGDPGIDEFLEKAGPFKIRECATLLNTETGKQEIQAYKSDKPAHLRATNEVGLEEWKNIYDKVIGGTTPTLQKVSSILPFTTASAGQQNSIYNIMIEFPKFWYCRPSRNTFLVSTKDQSDKLPGTKWFISPMHKRNVTKFTCTGYGQKINLDSNTNTITETEIYDYCYISKYGLSAQSDTTSHVYYAISANTLIDNTNSLLFDYNDTSISNGNKTVDFLKAIEDNSKFDTVLDYSIWSILWHLLLIKYATLDFHSYICASSNDGYYDGNGVNSYVDKNVQQFVNDTTNLEIQKTKCIFDIQNKDKLTHPTNTTSVKTYVSNNHWTVLGLSYYGLSPTFVPTLYVNGNLYATTFNILPWYKNLNGLNNTTATPNTNLTSAIGQYADICHKVINVGDSEEQNYYESAPGAWTGWTSFYWNENLSTNENKAWAFFAGGTSKKTTTQAGGSNSIDTSYSQMFLGYPFAATIKPNVTYFGRGAFISGCLAFWVGGAYSNVYSHMYKKNMRGVLFRKKEDLP